jgi:adenylylsulfate kinase
MTSNTCQNIVRYRGEITRLKREQLLNQRSKVFWFTGLSGSGKSTIAHHVEARLHAEGYLTYVFDGDNVRHGLCSDLGFDEKDRTENLRRIGEMVKLFLDAGIICLTAFISPFKKDRNQLRQIIRPENFIEIYVSCPLEVCEQRDVKGLYQLARTGKIKNYTGISSPYELPENPDLIIETHKCDVDKCVNNVLRFIKENNILTL